MRVGIVAIGRMKQGPERELCARYLERALATGRALGLSSFAVAELSESRAGSPATRKAEEAKAIAVALPEGVRVALDEHGKTMGSEDFARRIARWRDDAFVSRAVAMMLLRPVREMGLFGVGEQDGLQTLASFRNGDSDSGGMGCEPNAMAR